MLGRSKHSGRDGIVEMREPKDAVAAAFDTAAPGFDHHRALPDGVVTEIRQAILSCAAASPRPRLLDIGAGSGRIGRAFVAAGDDYVGVDRALQMLRAFVRRSDADHDLRLVQSDGEALPFADATFDVVVMVQVFGAAGRWRPLVAEARRVLAPQGSLVVGRTVAPDDGVDARMKQRLASFLAIRQAPYRTNAGSQLSRQLSAASCTVVTAARWSAQRTPRAFLDRHRTGARFSLLPADVRDEALADLAAWAADAFGSLDAVLREPHAFELRIVRFETPRERA